MLIKVIGAGAGGGLPQWNCNGQNSADARHGVPIVFFQQKAAYEVLRSLVGSEMCIRDGPRHTKTGLSVHAKRGLEQGRPVILPVSYTHLTLPTILRVKIGGVVVARKK